MKRGEVLQGQARKNTAAAFAFVFAVIATIRQLDQAKPGKPLWQKAIQMPYGFEPRKSKRKVHDVRAIQKAHASIDVHRSKSIRPVPGSSVHAL
ncbi:hypothetical protein [Caballeronia sp. KNU42]